MNNLKLWLTAAAMTVVVACQGRPSEEPPIHLNPNMDHQPKYKAQSEGGFYEEAAVMPNATMRPVPEGTVARGWLLADDVYYTGRDAKGALVKESPVPTTMIVLERGQERFNIYCSPCHGQIGNGKGIVGLKMPIPPTNLHDERLLKIEDGHFFDVMTNGIRNMSSYRSQVPVEDRWAIVSYIRALQRSGNATLNDVPQEKRKDLK